MPGATSKREPKTPSKRSRSPDGRGESPEHAEEGDELVLGDERGLSGEIADANPGRPPPPSAASPAKLLDNERAQPCSPGSHPLEGWKAGGSN